jgi:hypothetical protein
MLIRDMCSVCIDTDSNRSQNDVLSLDGTHIGEPISSHIDVNPRKIMKHFMIGES